MLCVINFNRTKFFHFIEFEGKISSKKTLCWCKSIAGTICNMYYTESLVRIKYLLRRVFMAIKLLCCTQEGGLVHCGPPDIAEVVCVIVPQHKMNT